MARHQRRRATTSKATRKATTAKRFFKKVQHNDPEIAKHWDFRKSRIQNMAKLGLACDVNVSMDKTTKPGDLDEDERVIQTVSGERVSTNCDLIRACSHQARESS